MSIHDLAQHFKNGSSLFHITNMNNSSSLFHSQEISQPWRERRKKKGIGERRRRRRNSVVVYGMAPLPEKGWTVLTKAENSSLHFIFSQNIFPEISPAVGVFTINAANMAPHLYQVTHASGRFDRSDRSRSRSCRS